jgi:hypothetical protein
VTNVSQQVDSCKVDEIWLWNWRGLANYVVPKIDVQVSAILRSQANTSPGAGVASNGASLSANYAITNAQVIAALGPAARGQCGEYDVDLTLPGELYGPRINSCGHALREDSCASAAPDPRSASISTICSNANTGDDLPADLRSAEQRRDVAQARRPS